MDGGGNDLLVDEQKTQGESDPGESLYGRKETPPSTFAYLSLRYISIYVTVCMEIR
jgi:hypothetical protein